MRKLIALALLGLLLFSASQPASAHAQLVSANPKTKQVVYAIPAQVKLMFSDDLIDLPDGNLIQVIDPRGKRIDNGANTLIGNQLSTGLKKSAVLGRYKVIYRVLSEDGHPISSTYWFTLAKRAVKSRG